MLSQPDWLCFRASGNYCIPLPAPTKAVPGTPAEKLARFFPNVKKKTNTHIVRIGTASNGRRHPIGASWPALMSRAHLRGFSVKMGLYEVDSEKTGMKKFQEKPSLSLLENYNFQLTVLLDVAMAPASAPASADVNLVSRATAVRRFVGIFA